MTTKISRFFVRKLRSITLNRELKFQNETDEQFDDIDELEFFKLKKRAREEIKNTLLRLAYRAKYNLPPNDPRFLNLTDEEIVYEMILQSEYEKWVQGIREEETEDNTIIYRNTEEFEAINRKLERGEDIDLESLMTSDEDWENVDGS